MGRVKALARLDYQVSHASSLVASAVYFTVCVGRVNALARLPSLSCKFTCCQRCHLYCMCRKSKGLLPALFTISYVLEKVMGRARLPILI